ncbi:MAG: glutathione S-transferase [Sphingomonadales bacterium]
MKFYDCRPAPSPRRVRICLAEKGLDIPVVDIDLTGGEHLGQDFRRISPQCTVPVLETREGVHLTETAAIYRYLEEVAPEPPLMGETPLEKALVIEWDHRTEIEGFMAVAEAFRNQSPHFKTRAIPGPVNYPQVAELSERGRKRTAAFLDTLNDRLSQCRYLAGDNYTVADISALVAVDFAGWIKIPMPESHQHLKRWHADVSARPPVRAATPPRP